MKPRTHLPCDDCGSSDALSDYGDGTYCFSCGTYRKAIDNVKLSLDSDFVGEYNKPRRTEHFGHFWNDIRTELDRPEASSNSTEGDTTLDIIPYRSISYDTYKMYGCYFKLKDGVPKELVFPYYKEGKEIGAKVRDLDIKKFYSTGTMAEASLFGMNLFNGGKTITITEGEMDAMSAYQMMGSQYPVVSVRSASQARKDCETSFKYLNSFEKIYLCFDSDEPGQKAVKEVAGLFDPNKVYHVRLNRYKDANEYLENGATKAFNQDWWAAKPYLPKGIVSDYRSIEEILNKEDNSSIATYPFQALNSMTYGIRSSELVLFTAQEKVGKTEVFRTIEHHLLKNTDYNMGIIHLEEEEKRSIQGLVGYELKVPAHLPDSGLSNTDILNSYKSLTKREGRCYFYSHFGSDDPNTILDTIRYLVVACHCKFIFLDHITMLVTGFESDDERKKLDYISTKLAMMTRELDFTLFLISHVNDDGKTRGSRNISKVADLIINLDRNIEADSLEERNKTHLMVKGNRFAGLSGPCGTLWFDPKSFTLAELTVEDVKSSDRTAMEAQEIVRHALESPDYRADSLWATTPQQEERPSA